MGRFLQAWCYISIILLVFVTAQGFWASSLPPLGAMTSKVNHVVMGFLCTVVVLFAHTITMFYFIGTGSAVKEEAKKNPALLPLYQTTRRFKARTSGILTLAPLLLMAASITGAGAAGGSLSAKVHLWMELGAVIFNVWTLWKAAGVIQENIVLMTEANRIVSMAPDLPSPSAT